MTYSEATDFLFRAVPMFQRDGASAYKPGLERIKTLDQIFQYPHRAYQTIHVGGTNGKGSTSHSLAAILQAQGYRVGLFTSPHLIDFRERIRVNGEMISQEAVIHYTEQFISFVEKYHPSFFELTTIMALDYFKQERVDFAIIEVGLGGRLDSTNIISPLLSIITNISFDHTQFLGNSLEAIAYEKAGIIKPKTSIILGRSIDQSVNKVFEDVASKQNANLYYADQLIHIEHGIQNGGYTNYTTPLGEISLELNGQIQKENLQTILVACKQLQLLGIHLPMEAIQKGLSNITKMTGLRGRWEEISTSPWLICDTAHNPDGLHEVVKQLKSYQIPLRIVLGMARDKDIITTLNHFPKDAYYYFTQAQGDRSLPAEEFGELASSIGLKGKVFPTLPLAVTQAQRDWRKGELIFVGGSNFIIAELLEYTQE